MLRQVQSDRSNLAHGWLPFAADSITAVWHSDAARGPSTPSFDHLVGAGEQRRWHIEAERPSGVEVDHQLELGRLHDWQVHRLGAIEDTRGIEPDLAKGIGEVGSVAHQPAGRKQKRVANRLPEPRKRAAKTASWTRRALRKAPPATNSASAFSRTRLSKAASISRPVAASNTRICCPIAAALTSRSNDSLTASVALFSRARRLAAGTSSRNSCMRFAVNSMVKKLTPVALPPGRLRLATKPSLTGSSLTPNTIGIVVVAALAASAAAVVPGAAITLTRRRTRSAASSGKRSYRPSAQR